MSATDSEPMPASTSLDSAIEEAPSAKMDQVVGSTEPAEPAQEAREATLGADSESEAISPAPATEEQLAALESSIATLHRRRVTPAGAAAQDEGAGSSRGKFEPTEREDRWLETFIEESGQEEQDVIPEEEAVEEPQQPALEAQLPSTSQDSNLAEDGEADEDLENKESKPFRRLARTYSTASEAASVLQTALLSGSTAPPQVSATEAIVSVGQDSAEPFKITSSKPEGVIATDLKGRDSVHSHAASSVFAESDEVLSDLESEEVSEDEEPEPSLNYTKLRGGVADIFKKDTASTMAVSDRFLALGTHSGMIYILDIEGNLVKGFKSHSASILALNIDKSSEFVASAGMDGLVSISALSTAEQYVFDFRRPMRCVALEPNFARKSTRSFVCGGMAGALLQREKSWFGHKEVVLHAGEGPVWNVQWKGNLIAWANDKGVRIYDTATKQRITFITPPQPDIRADMYRCTLFWRDAHSLLIAWGDHIKIAKVKEKGGKPVPSSTSSSAVPGLPTSPRLYVEVQAIYQLDSNISGIVPYGNDFLTLVYIVDDVEDSDGEEEQVDRRFKRQAALPPELRIITSEGEEHSSDALSISNYARYSCNDYLLVPSADSPGDLEPDQRIFYVLTPTDIVVARQRTRKDHIDWLIEKRHYAQVLSEIEALGSKDAKILGYDSADIGRKYLQHLVERGKFERAAKVTARILGRDAKAWEDWIFLFVERGQLRAIIPHIPIEDPTLSEIVYDMVLAHFLQTDSDQLLKTIEAWPPHIYSTPAVIRAIEDKLKKEPSSIILLESLAAIFIANRQPGKALPYYLRLRKPHVFDLIREHNLFSDVRDQALSLMEFDEAISEANQDQEFGSSIHLLVDHTFSIPVTRVVPQLEENPRYLHYYLDALFRKDSQSVVPYADKQVQLYADYDPQNLMGFLRTMSSYYKFEEAYEVCKAKDLVPEMVFLLGRVGDNKRALMLIIERLDDVEKAIDFAKEQNDDELWEDLLKYAETRPAFIRGLLENVGAEIDPLRLIRRIKDGLQIPGLKAALIKILQEFNLQVSLLDDCAAILYHDGLTYSQELTRAQREGMQWQTTSTCSSCEEPLFRSSTFLHGTPHLDDTVADVYFLCRHVYHLSCLVSPERIPKRNRGALPSLEVSVTQAGPRGDGMYGPDRRSMARKKAFDDKLRYEARLRTHLKKGCPACHKRRASRDI